MQTKCANREAFPIVTNTKTEEDKCSETKKGKGKITMMKRRGGNRKVSKLTQQHSLHDESLQSDYMLFDHTVCTNFLASSYEIKACSSQKKR